VKLRHADIAWIILATYVIAYDANCKDGEQLSHGVDRYLLRRPWLTRAVVLTTSAHLLNLLPRKVDPFHLTAALFGR
jgi:hypothetical protein